MKKPFLRLLMVMILALVIVSCSNDESSETLNRCAC